MDIEVKPTVLNEGEKLPPKAKLVFKGSIYEVWQWQQKMFDGTTQTYERLIRPDAVEIIASVGDKIIVEEQEQSGRAVSFYSLPGGRADGGGTPLEEAKREFREETGYVSDDWELWQTIVPNNKTLWSIYYFFARNCRLAGPQKLDGGEKISVKLLSFEDFLLLSDSPRLRGSEIMKMMLRMRLHPELKEDFRKKLFPAGTPILTPAADDKVSDISGVV